jgi:hypothetical protein
MNKEQIEQIINDVCPRCAKGEALKFRQDSGEWVHVAYTVAAFSSTLCLATHLRSKYQDVLNG